MKLIFMGTPEFSVPVLEALVAAGHEICAVYSQPPRKAGRGKKLRLSPIHACAESLQLTVRTPENFLNPDDIREFADLEADAAVVVAYGLILPSEILNAPKAGCLNIHASLLPRWRGAAPIHRAIMAGDKKTGICVMQMEQGLDTGPVLMREETQITSSDTTATLHDRLAGIGADLTVKALADLPNLSPVHQSVDGVTYAKKISKEEARIDWNLKASEVDQMIRGLSPFPGAWFEHQEERIKVLMSNLESQSGEPGEVLDSNLTIGCAEGSVAMTKLQRAGKSAMDRKEFLLGYPIDVGQSLSSDAEKLRK